MFDSKSRSTMFHAADNDRLVQRLNADAETSRPEFSVRLQARISSAVADRRLRAARRAIDEPWSWTAPWKTLALGWSVRRLVPTTAIAGILLIAVCWYAMPKAGTLSNAGTSPETGTSFADPAPTTQPSVGEDDALARLVVVTADEVGILVRASDASRWVDWEEELGLTIDGVLDEFLFDEAETL